MKERAKMLEKLKAKLQRVTAFAAVAFALTLAFAGTAAAETDLTESVSLINEMMPLIITIMVLSLILGLLGGVFAGMKFGGKR